MNCTRKSQVFWEKTLLLKLHVRLTEPSVQVLKRYTLLVPVFTVNSFYSVSLAWQQDKPTIAIFDRVYWKDGTRLLRSFGPHEKCQWCRYQKSVRRVLNTLRKGIDANNRSHDCSKSSFTVIVSCPWNFTLTKTKNREQIWDSNKSQKHMIYWVIVSINELEDNLANYHKMHALKVGFV